MKKLMMILSIVMLAACAKGPDGSPGATGSPGAPGNDAPAPPSFAGFYVLPDNGYMEIVQDSGSLNDLTQIRIVVKNADASSGVLPLTSALNIPTTNGSIYYFANLTYAAPNNVKTDSGGTVLVGSFFTMITVSESGGLLHVHVQISNGTPVIFDHSIVEIL